MTRQEAGRLGGQRTYARYGREHMQCIGRQGYLAAASVIERPGLGAITYDRQAWLIHKLRTTHYAVPAA